MDGKLLFRNNDQVLSVEILPGGSFASSPAREVIRGGWFNDPWGDQSWDVAPDGRFLFLRPAAGSRVQGRVIQNWMPEFRAAPDAAAARDGGT